MSKALELDPYLARANGYMGAIRRRQGRVQEAVSYLRKAVEMQPEWAMPYLELGRSYKLIEDLDKARTALKRGLALDPVNAEMRALLRELSAGPSP
ncbi:MAG: tetratricopeptide repeat protein [Thermodesulfobacteriota bacterium]|nr:tetratricopeptide repeat protein [Thermodesulfobacteriota bacterium]